jgi:hypothetical protein
MYLLFIMSLAIVLPFSYDIYQIYIYRFAVRIFNYELHHNKLYGFLIKLSKSVVCLESRICIASFKSFKSKLFFDFFGNNSSSISEYSLNTLKLQIIVYRGSFPFTPCVQNGLLTAIMNLCERSIHRIGLIRISYLNRIILQII